MTSQSSAFAMHGFLFPLFIIPVVWAKIVKLEVEDFKLKKFEPWIYRDDVMMRSRASHQFSVHLFQNDVVIGEFCLPGYRKVEIVNMMYSNDGPTDLIDIHINRKHIGTVQAKMLIGGKSDWNDFRSSWNIGKPMILPPGRHTVTLNVSTSDRWGTELDVILFNVEDGDLTEKAFRCALFCFEDINYSDVGGRRDDVPSAKFVQYSTSATCGEDDNVKVAIYHDTARKFVITASGPKYRSFGNYRKPTYEGCKITNPIWKFNNVSVEPSRTPVESARALIRFAGKNDNTEIIVTFAAIERLKTRDFRNLNVGSTLYVKLRKISSVVQVFVAYIGQKRTWTELSWQSFDPEILSRNWSIPDWSWSEQTGNLVKLTFVRTLTEASLPIVIEEIGLEERKLNNSKRVIFDNEEFIVEGIDLDFWWQRDKNMTVSVLQNGNSYFDIDCVRINYRQQWEADLHSRIFEICQDGLVKLAPPAPHGLDWIPFGSSVVLGAADPRFPRPYTDIISIGIDTRTVSLSVLYRDNSSLTLSLQPSYLETRLFVQDVFVSMDKQAKLPLITFLSMWVADGNADVDHITVNGDSPRHIIRKWGALYGVSATFFRQCISSHNTQSPDIRIDILGENEDAKL
ncbi:uncharacterized protein LOC110454775 [Mizuhopecten yessoensis]|uniref:Uncharacterized protein n=1 Tax=Mizuhopecten yessoensis TaxID=6573 RepID=A0A210QEJ8_MIZYE|nr:uncharacterized protein LOC110454775 [Mizuhopecten yessoensis]XP_021360146.1 uncharacterized protein LOC110454775 [Mizuhopecten yessoensis]OWF47139.1 hypothetical protein KP79_PYT07147 [Mizuhopecten yessoensis]